MTTNPFFCAEASRWENEDIVGSATQYPTYILIECPTPWAANAMESDCLPPDLRQLIQATQRDRADIRFLLINRNNTKTATHKKVIIYTQKSQASQLAIQPYLKYEFTIATLDDAITVIQSYLEDTPQLIPEFNAFRDLLICTHGSHDQCCARYGNPFFAQATDLVTELVTHPSLETVRVWRSSHFGGHRFAPTAIHFPDGRYYGRLDRASLQAILTRTGNLRLLETLYRGWSLLPAPIQALERELWIRFGWDWLDAEVQCRDWQLDDHPVIHAEMQFTLPQHPTQLCRATLQIDREKTLELRGSCQAVKASTFVKYRVRSLQLLSERMACLIP